MPPGKRRLDLTPATQARIDGQTEALAEAAVKAGRLHAWLDTSRPGADTSEPLAIETPVAAPAKRKRLWPFGRKVDRVAERKAQILAELEAAVAGRPGAAQKVAEPPAPAVETERRRATG